MLAVIVVVSLLVVAEVAGGGFVVDGVCDPDAAGVAGGVATLDNCEEDEREEVEGEGRGEGGERGEKRR